LATFGTNYINFYKKLKKNKFQKFFFSSKEKQKVVMKENEQIIWNSLFSKQNIQNYLIIEPTCPEAEVIVYFGEYYSFCIFWEKAWLMIVNNIHEVNKRLKRARNWQICVKPRARISLLLFRVSFVNSLLIFTLWYFVMTSLVMRPVVYGGHDSKSNLRVSCTKRIKIGEEKEVKYTKDVVWHGKCELEFLGQLWKEKSEKTCNNTLQKALIIHWKWMEPRHLLECRRWYRVWGFMF